MTSKDLNKVQNEVKKASEKTLTGAVKAWCQLFNHILQNDSICIYLLTHKSVEAVNFKP